jgi:hypothetical protein
VGALGPFERALVIHAAQTGHFRDGGKVAVHLVSTQARADEASLRREYPGITECVGLKTHLLGDEGEFVGAAAALVSDCGPGALVTLLRCGSPEPALTDALLLSERVQDGPVVRALLDAPGDSGVRKTVEEMDRYSPGSAFCPISASPAGPRRSSPQSSTRSPGAFTRFGRPGPTSGSGKRWRRAMQRRRRSTAPRTPTASGTP